MLPTFHLYLSSETQQLESLRARLREDASAFQHPSHEEDAFVVCASELVASSTRDALAQNAECALGNAALLLLRSGSATVHQLGAERLLAHVETLLTPLWSDVLRVVDEHGTDVSERFLATPELLFR